MEPVSFALAIGSIPGIFTSCVDCFQYVQLGKHFGDDYGDCLAQLEAAEIRLLRWGEPMGFLDEHFDPDELFQKGPWKEDEIAKAKKWLGLILSQFEKARERSEEYKDIVAESPGDLVIPDQAQELDKASQPLRKLISWTRSVAKKRQKHLSLGKKVKWALYRKAEFESMIEKIGRLTNSLVELFPNLKPRQEELCREEVRDLPPESMPALIEVLKNNDELLNRAVAAEIKSQGHVFNNVTFDGSGFARLGDTHEYGSNKEATSMSFTGLKIGGTGVFHGGHHFEGPGSSPSRVLEKKQKSAGENE